MVRITHLDGKLPNLALMRLSAWHKHCGDQVHFTKRADRDLLEPTAYDRVYASSIFTASAKARDRHRAAFPDSMTGGTGYTDRMATTLADAGVPADFDGLDYSIYPAFPASIGFTQRGCRLKCGFCVVPRKEGANRSTQSIADIWRGPGHPRHLHLLDNDFFGQEHWRERADEIIRGGFKVCFSQGINIRLFDAEQAGVLAQMDYRDNKFKGRRIYTAWDNLGQEAIFFRGVETLRDAGIPPRHIMAYMLIGYSVRETLDDILYRVDRMVQAGVLPYPMAYHPCRGRVSQDTLRDVQRWVIRRYYQFMPFGDYGRAPERIAAVNLPELF